MPLPILLPSDCAVQSVYSLPPPACDFLFHFFVSTHLFVASPRNTSSHNIISAYSSLGIASVTSYFPAIHISSSSLHICVVLPIYISLRFFMSTSVSSFGFGFRRWRWPRPQIFRERFLKKKIIFSIFSSSHLVIRFMATVRLLFFVKWRCVILGTLFTLFCQ